MKLNLILLVLLLLPYAALGRVKGERQLRRLGSGSGGSEKSASGSGGGSGSEDSDSGSRRRE